MHEQPKPILKSIDSYNLENPKAATAARSAAATVSAKKKCTRRPDGTARYGGGVCVEFGLCYHVSTRDSNLCQGALNKCAVPVVLYFVADMPTAGALFCCSFIPVGAVAPDL